MHTKTYSSSLTKHICNDKEPESLPFDYMLQHTSQVVIFFQLVLDGSYYCICNNDLKGQIVILFVITSFPNKSLAD